MPLSEHVYCVVVAFKMTKWVEQWTWIKFCIKLEHSSMETIWMIQKAAAIGNWWLAASSWQYACLCTTFHAEFFGEASNHPGYSPLYSPDLAPCDFWLFPKLKSLLKGKRFQTAGEIQETTTKQLMGELCEVSRCLPWRGLRCHCPVYSVLYLVTSSINVSIFYITWLDTFWIDVIVCMK